MNEQEQKEYLEERYEELKMLSKEEQKMNLMVSKLILERDLWANDPIISMVAGPGAPEAGERLKQSLEKYLVLDITIYERLLDETTTH